MSTTGLPHSSGDTRWHAVAASRRGARHTALGMPNQDAYAVAVDGGCTAIAVADGHGDSAHPRSGEGARIAADIAVALMAEAGSACGADIEYLRNLLLGDVGPRMVNQWRAGVLEHQQVYPWTAAETTALGTATPDAGRVFRAYGTTVLAFVVTPDVFGAFQIGDGDIVVAFRGGMVQRPVPDDLDLIGTKTTSLCQPDPLQSLRVAALPLTDQPIILAWASTDGFGAQRADARGWWRRVGSELVSHLQANGVGYLDAKLPVWLVEPAELGGDDTTVAMLVDSEFYSGSDRPTVLHEPGSVSVAAATAASTLSSGQKGPSAFPIPGATPDRVN